MMNISKIRIDQMDRFLRLTHTVNIGSL